MALWHLSGLPFQSCCANEKLHIERTWNCSSDPQCSPLQEENGQALKGPPIEGLKYQTLFVSWCPTLNVWIFDTCSACGGELYQTVVLEERIHERHVIRMMRQVLEGVAFLHDRNIVHLDVKVSTKVILLMLSRSFLSCGQVYYFSYVRVILIISAGCLSEFCQTLFLRWSFPVSWTKIGKIICVLSNLILTQWILYMGYTDGQK